MAGLGALMFLLGIMSLLVGCEVDDLRTFEIQGVVHPRESRYEISCWSLDFSETASQVHLQVFDRETPHEFLKFRFEEIEKYSNLLLVPKKSGDLNTARKYKLLNIKHVSTDVLFPTPQSKNIAAFMTLEFEPLTKGEPNEIVPGPLDVNEAWLQFEDFPPLKLLRNRPVMWAWDAFLLNHISKRDASIMIGYGVMGILAPLGIGGFALLLINLSGKVETQHKTSTERTSSEPSTSAVDGKACASISSAEAAEDIGEIGRGDWI